MCCALLNSHCWLVWKLHCWNSQNWQSCISRFQHLSLQYYKLSYCDVTMWYILCYDSTYDINVHKEMICSCSGKLVIVQLTSLIDWESGLEAVLTWMPRLLQQKKFSGVEKAMRKIQFMMGWESRSLTLWPRKADIWPHNILVMCIAGAKGLSHLSRFLLKLIQCCCQLISIRSYSSWCDFL